jgi:hypothetical protein
MGDLLPTTGTITRLVNLLVFKAELRLRTGGLA